MKTTIAVLHLTRTTKDLRSDFALIPPPKHPEAALTRVDLVVVLATVTLLAAIVLPVLASNRTRSEQVACLNNLRQVGRALQMWSSDHGGRVPWWTSYSEGGLRNAPPALQGYVNEVYFHFLWMSNEVGTPRILACPGDPLVKVSGDFSRNPFTGFDNPAFRNNAVSYFLGTDVFSEDLQGIVCGDRSLRSNSYPSGCSSAIQNVAVVNHPAGSYIGWSPGIHGESGNLLLNDGRAVPTSDSELRQALDTSEDYGGRHFAYPIRP